MTIASWFHEQLLARAIAAAVWTLLLQTPLILLLRIFLSDYQGFQLLSVMLQIGSFSSVLLIPLSICALTFLHIKYFKVTPIVMTSRWVLLKEISSPSFILLLCSYSLLGGVLMNSYFGSVNPRLGTLSTQCSNRGGWCLNEHHLFGVLFGGLLGLTESWNYYFSERRLITVPFVQQHIKVAVWTKVVPFVKSSLAVVSRKYLFYAALYYLIGSSVRSYVLGVTRLAVDEPLDTIVGLLNLSLAFCCIITGSSVLFTIRLSNLLFQLFEAKPVSFPAVRLPDDTSPLLQEAVSSNVDLLRLWACRDWSVLAEQSPERRGVIFSVSQPGNHPHVWNSVIAAVLPPCLQFVSTLKGEVKVAKVEPKETSEQFHSPAPFDSFTTPTRMRSMALKSPAKVIQSTEEPKPSLQESLYAKFEEMLENLKKKPIINFVWGELPDAKRRQAFAKAEPIMYLIEGLSFFVTASYTEDTFGVVQKDLPDILSMLLDLQTVVEKRGASSGVLPNRAEVFASPSTDVQLKHRLKWTVKSSIYRLVVKFQRHIMNVPLAPAHKQMLEQYLEFRVG